MAKYVRLCQHGGGCCGIKHIQNMSWDTYSFDENIAAIRRMIASNARVKGKLFEIVLNTAQMKNTRLVAFLKETGFRMVSRFNNNTGSICHVFHYHLNPLPLT